MSDRDTYKYDFRKGRKIVHTGITVDLERREKELQTDYGEGKITQVDGKSSREGALEWEDGQRKKGKPTGP